MLTAQLLQLLKTVSVEFHYRTKKSKKDQRDAAQENLA